MTRFILLAGYFYLMLQLEVTHKIDQYINRHYRYLVWLSLIFSLFLALFQLYLWVKQGEEKAEHHEHHHEHHGHHHHQTLWQRITVYILLTLPLIVGFCFPQVSLDATVVAAKGFHFPISKESVGDPEMKTQYLKPDTSMYFNKQDYTKEMNERLKDYRHEETLEVTDQSYLTIMELIYNYPSEFVGKKLTYQGFIYHDPVEKANRFFVFRFGIIHCVADSGVFGLLNYFPTKNQQYKDNDWVSVTGTIQTDYYSPFKTTIPVLKVTKIETIKKPANQYVYYQFK